MFFVLIILLLTSLGVKLFFLSFLLVISNTIFEYLVAVNVWEV